MKELYMNILTMKLERNGHVFYGTRTFVTAVLNLLTKNSFIEFV